MNNLSTRAILIVVITLIALFLFMSMSRMVGCGCGMNCRCGMGSCNCPYKMEGFSDWDKMEDTSYNLYSLDNNKIIRPVNHRSLPNCQRSCEIDPTCKGFFYVKGDSLIDGGYAFPQNSCIRFNTPLEAQRTMDADVYMKK